MAKQRVTEWFVRHFNPHTNKVIAEAAPDAECVSVKDVDGNELRAWQVPHSIISMLRGLGPGEGVSFAVYSREKNYGPVRRNEFTRPKSKNRGPAYKNAQEDLKEATDGKQPQSL